MKSAFRINSPPGSSGAQTTQFVPVLGHPGVLRDLVIDFTFQGRNAAAATSPITARTGRGGVATGQTAGGVTLTGGGSSAGAFPEQPSGTTGNDDMDNLLNAIWGGTGNNWILNLGVGRIVFDQQPAVQLRTLLSPLGGGNDVISRNLLDYPIVFPSSASGTQFYSLQILIPLSLGDYLLGGHVFSQGTDGLRDASLLQIFQAPASFVNVAGATINLTVQLQTLFANYSHEGDGSWVGPHWRSYRQIYGGNNPALKPGHYIMICDSSTQSGNAIGGAGINASPVTQYNGHGQWNFDQLSLGFLRAMFQDDRITPLGYYDISERTVPVLMMYRDDLFEHLPFAIDSQNIDASAGGPSSTTLITVEMIPRSPTISAQVAGFVGGGGDTTGAHPLVKGGSYAPAAGAAFYPVIRKAGKIAGGTTTSGPTQTAMHVESTNTAALATAAKRAGR